MLEEENPEQTAFSEEPPAKRSRHSPSDTKPSLVMNLKLKDDQYERVDDNSRPSTALGLLEPGQDAPQVENPPETSAANSTHGEEEEEEPGPPPARDIRATSVVADRRRVRGRRRTRGGPSTLSTRPQRAAASRTATPDDVYEFRSSPESDDEYDGGKRRRTAVSEDRTYDDLHDEHSRSIESEKKRVPPLRITLNLKPSGDEESNLGDSGSSPRSHSSTPKPAQPSPPSTGKRGGRGGRGGAWGGTRKSEHAEDSTHGQRMTRSKVRQSGAVLDDSILSQRRGKGYRRGGLTSSASSNSVAAVLSTGAGEDTASNSPVGESSGTPDSELLVNPDVSFREPSSDPAAQAAALSNVPAPLKLTYEHSFQGFRGMRKMIEQKWLRDSRDVDMPHPKGFSDYLLCSQDYKLATDEAMANGKGINAKLMALPPDLRRLAEEQEERRHDLATEHETERTRLQLFAEKEYMRLLRRERSTKPVVSAIRVAAESEIYNPMYVDDEERLRKPPPRILRSQLLKKCEEMSKEMRLRHYRQAETLHCVQMRMWEMSVKKYIDAQPSPKVTFSFPAENYVHEVAVSLLAFSFD